MEQNKKILTIKEEINYNDEFYDSSITVTLESDTTSKVIEFRDGCDEDNTLSRNFKDCYSIVECFKIIENHIKSGYDIEYQHEELDGENDDNEE